jgi:hypothetical protein
MRVLRNAFAILSLLVVSSTVLATPSVVDVSQQHPGPISLTENLDILEDVSGSMGIREVQQGDFATRFQTNFGVAEELNFGFTDSAYWVRTRLTNPTQLPVERILELAFARISEVDFFLVASDGSVESSTMGMARPFASRPYLHHNFVFPVTVHPCQNGLSTFA